MPKQLTEAEKSAKAQVILNNTREMFVDMRYADITMSALAKRCGIAKGSVFRHFETKETIFSIILYDEYDKWIEAEKQAIAAHDSFSKEEYYNFVMEQTETVVKNWPILVRLVSIKRTILDHNVSVEILSDEMERLTRGIMMLARETCEKIDFMQERQVFDLYVNRHIVLIGSYNLATSMANQEKLNKIHNTDLIQLDFERLAINATRNQMKAEVYCK